MTQQLDMMPGALLDDAVLQRIDAQLPKAREVTPRLPLQACMHPVDVLKVMAAKAGVEVPAEQEAWMRGVCDEVVTVDHELAVAEWAREDHR